MKKWICILLNLLFLFTSTHLYAAGTEADTAAIRDLLQRYTKALNDEQLENLRPFLDDQFTIITMDNSKANSLNDFKTYLNNVLHGKNSKIIKMFITPVADSQPFFINDSVSVLEGTANETYHFKNGEARDLKTRWTAVFHKENNQWKIMKIHFSANALDNPILDIIKSQMFNVGLFSGLIGLILGAILTFAFRRKPM